MILDQNSGAFRKNAGCELKAISRRSVLLLGARIREFALIELGGTSSAFGCKTPRRESSRANFFRKKRIEQFLFEGIS